MIFPQCVQLLANTMIFFPQLSPVPSSHTVTCFNNTAHGNNRATSPTHYLALVHETGGSQSVREGRRMERRESIEKHLCFDDVADVMYK